MATLRRIYSVIEMKDFDDSKREFEGIATTVGVDRYGDIVESEGAIYELPLPLLWQHISSQPVGHINETKPTKKNIRIKGTVANLETPGILKDRLDEAWQSMKLNLVRFLSIGFRPKEWEWMSDDSFGMHFLTWEWLETSLVTIPANADAAITAVKNMDLRAIKRYDTEIRKAASGNKFRSFEGVPLIGQAPPGVSGKHGVSLVGPYSKGAVRLVSTK